MSSRASLRQPVALQFTFVTFITSFLCALLSNRDLRWHSGHILYPGVGAPPHREHLPCSLHWFLIALRGVRLLAFNSSRCWAYRSFALSRCLSLSSSEVSFTRGGGCGLSPQAANARSLIFKIWYHRKPPLSGLQDSAPGNPRSWGQIPTCRDQRLRENIL